MSWLYLAAAVVLEVVFVLGMRSTAGFTRLWPTVFTAAAATGSVVMLSLALVEIDVGVGYTVWTGVGAVGTVLIGALVFGERLTARKAASFVAIVAGVAGLHLLGA